MIPPDTGRAGRLLGAEPPLWLVLILGLLAGLLACGYFVGYGDLLETARAAAPPGDQAQAMSGAVAFLGDVWRFPLFEVAGWVEDRRVNVLFTDSIPIYLIAWKLLGLGPETAAHYYLPSWMVISFAFQGLSGALALRLLGVRGWLALLAGALMLASMPFFVFRFGHLALATHGLVLIAIALALLRFPAEARGAVVRLVAWSGLLALSLLVHPYLFAMVGGLWAISIAVLLLLAREEGLPLPPAALAVGVGATLALLLGIMLVSGHLSGGGSGASGFGRFSANLATFFMPAGRSAFFPADPVWPLGQYEGFAYLPVGALLLIAAAAALLIRFRLPATLGEGTVLGTRPGRWLLALAAVFLVIFAAGGSFYWFETQLLTISYPPPLNWLGDVFRSSGRFIWLIGYTLVIVAIAVAALRLPRAPAALGIAAATGLALVELAPMRNELPKGAGTFTSDPGLRAIFQSVERVAIHPVKPCGQGRSHADGELQYLSARHGLTLANSFYSAREEVDCSLPAATALPDSLPADTAVFILTPTFAVDLELAGLPLAQCRRRLDLTICLADWQAHPDLAAEFPPLEIDRLPVPVTLAMVKAERAARWLGEGFSDPEPWGVWSTGTRSTLILPLAEGTPAPGTVTLRAGAFLFPGVGDVPVRLALDARAGDNAPWQPQDETVAVWREGDGQREVTLASALPGATALRIVIEPEAPRSPRDAGISDDDRPLGLSLTELRIAPGGS
ncbi:MAG: DUF6311 domain-containing protein [Pseudomonadota bacterium]